MRPRIPHSITIEQQTIDHYHFIWLVFLFLLALLTSSISGSCQKPQWQWAKSAGGAHQEDLLVNISGTTIQTDTLGNTYEIIKSRSATMDIGAFHFTNPGGSGAQMAYLVKYNAAGTPAWVQIFPPLSATRGIPVTPLSLFTTPDGYSYVSLPFEDSIKLGNMVLKDSTIHHSSFGSNYCIARYDPAGNVTSIHAYKAAYSGMQSITAFFDHLMLGLVYSGYGDTLGGHPVAKGYTLVILDSVGRVSLVKSLGYDSSVQLLSPAQVAVSGRSVYIEPSLWKPALLQAAIPISDLAPYSAGADRHLLIKFDSLLDFQWYKVYNHVLNQVLAPDASGNVYLAGGATSAPVNDTLIYDTVRIVMPYLPPFGTNNYLVTAKVGANGSLAWSQKLVNSSNGSVSALYADQIGNVYLAGKYGGYLRSSIDTLTESSNLFISKTDNNGQQLWLVGSHNAQNASTISGLSGDRHGNIFINGLFAYPTVHPFYGTDSLVCHTPVSGSPGAQDAYIARLGACPLSTRPTITSVRPLYWCGLDSVVLTATASQHYLWNTGDTTPNILVRNSGDYSVYMIDSMGCFGQSASVSVHAWPVPVVQASLVRDVACYGGHDGAISLHFAGGTPPYSYTATPGIADTSSVPAGIYIISTTDSAGCRSLRDTVRVSEPGAPLLVYTDTIPASLSMAGTAIATAAGGTLPYSYMWGTDPSQQGDTARHLLTGWYQVTVTDAHGCQAVDSAYIRLISTSLEAIEAARPVMYPDPVSDVLYLSIDHAGTCSIYDASGRLTLHQNLMEGVTHIETSTWTQSVYLVEFQDIKNNVRTTQKIVVLH